MNRKEEVSTTRDVLTIAAISFVVGMVAFGAISALGFTELSFGAIIIGMSLSAAVIAPVVYWVIMKPTRQRTGEPALRAGRALKKGLTITDPLTRTMNRYGITISLMDAMALGERYGNPLSAVMFDVDRLEQINSKHGQKAGDSVLEGVAALLADALRMPDKIGRYEEDEFVLVMPQTNIDDASNIAERLCSLVAAQEFNFDGQAEKITTSVGVTQFQQGDDLESMMSRMQQAVDKSRNAGRSRVTSI